MTKDEISAKVRDILRDVLCSHEGAITDEAELVNDLGCDSLDMVEITMECEERFDLGVIPDEEVEHLKKVSDLVALVERRLQGTAA